MSNTEIKHLFKYHRLPQNDVKLLFFILYCPIGLILFAIRAVLIIGLFLLAHIVSDTPITQKIVNKIATFALGISVSVENPKVKESVDVYVSNSLSVFDHVVVASATGAISPGTRVFLEKMLVLSNYCFGNVSNFDNFKKNIYRFITEKKIPVYFAPEGKPTNGRALLKFKTYPFQFATKVQPICLSLERPFLDISVTTLGSSYFSDVFFFMFSPSTNYKLKFLSPLEKKTHTDAEFADLVCESIAKALKKEATNFTSNDLVEFEKQKILEEQRRSEPRRSVRSMLDSELQRMTLQVREVLPHVPFTAIYNDLSNTRSVDNTITNILEGRIHFTPEQNTSSNTSKPSTSGAGSVSSSTRTSDSSSNYLFNTAATSFAKNATERSKSFHERKEQLIANARRRYIEKHNLDVPV